MSSGVTKIQHGGNTAAQIAIDNPKLLERQLAFETDTLRMKLGDGVTLYNSLAYITFPVQFTTAAGIVAGTTQTQADGFALTKQINEVSTVANDGDTVVLPTAVAGDTCIVINNDSAEALRIFPFSGDDLGAGTNVALSIDLAPGAVATFLAYDANNWSGTVANRET